MFGVPWFTVRLSNAEKSQGKLQGRWGWNGNYSCKGKERAEHLCNKQCVLESGKYPLNSSLLCTD